MKAYVVVDITVKDAAAYDGYKRLTPASLEPYGGKFVVRGGATETLEGQWAPTRLVIVEFPSAAKARAWWSSPEYAAAKALRQRCADTDMVLIEGVDGPPS
jgi:uncharacterized protein (DUF1330 family)